jgi:hypothetical protein
LGRGLGRQDQFFVSERDAPEYRPNKERYMKDLGKVAVFSKMSSRKPIYDLRYSPEAYDISFQAVEA